ncbi:BRCA1-associated RING domain protein 1-like [Xylocopa sonorina]|uniref:BRCA1-associated RING domain protein 1-like n=1 Tax=Xylocopa sonorina TaxID=1818115 RepID=UPI00403A833B
MNKWENTYEALKNFAKVLACSKCGCEPSNAVRYTNCGHFFCKQCAENDSVCTKCSAPVQPMEKCNDDLIDSLVRYCSNAAEIIGKKDLWSTTANTRTKQLDNTKRINSPISKKLIPKNINKKNAKGETQLHAACLKNKEELVRTLLAAGADPNTKDHSGWTPLQEVVSYGYTDICQLLLECGASPNTPGEGNRTALHDAVIKNRLLETKMLLKRKAKKDVFDNYGKKPIDYCEPNSEIWSILANENGSDDEVEEAVALNCSSIQPFPVLYASSLNEEKKKYIERAAAKHKIKIASAFRSTVTHVIVEADAKNIVELSYDVMMALLHGCWLLNTEWIQLGMNVNDVLNGDLDLFEVSGAPVVGVPRKARESAQKKNPGLFHQCHFYFHPQANNVYQINGIELTKEALVALVQAADGSVLTREPNPEDVRSREPCIHFHIAKEPNHPLYRCTHYNIYVPERNEPRIKYNMPHIKTLPLIWLVECVEKFTLVDPSHLGLLKL